MNKRQFNFTRLELSLDKCLGNFRYFRDKLEKSTKMLVLVKANAYGHGAVAVASMMQQAGADYLAVRLEVFGGRMHCRLLMRAVVRRRSEGLVGHLPAAVSIRLD